MASQQRCCGDRFHCMHCGDELERERYSAPETSRSLLSSAVAWNSLSAALRITSLTVATFGRHLKPYLFSCEQRTWGLFILRCTNVHFIVITARSELRKVLFLPPSVCVFCFCMKCLGNRRMDLGQIHKKDVFVPSLGQVWSSRSPGTKTAFSALSAAYVRFVFGKTSLASSYGRPM